MKRKCSSKNHDCICEREAIGQKILVVGGWKGINETNEVIDLENGKFTCPIPSVHMGSFASGGIINGLPLVCGGQIKVEYEDNTYSNIRHCYKLQHGHWINVHNLTRFDYASLGTGDLVVENQLLLSGISSYGKNSSYNELIGLNSTSNIADTPVAIDNHCIVRLNKTHFMSSGGDSNRTRVNWSYFYNIETDVWSFGPLLNHARSHHGCSMITLGGVDYVFVLGDTESFGSFEYLSLSDIEAGWTIVELDEPYYYISSVTLIRQNNNTGFYIVSNKGIYDLLCDGDQSPPSCQVIDIENTRANFNSWTKTIIPIDEDLANELCPKLCANHSDCSGDKVSFILEFDANM